MKKRSFIAFLLVLLCAVLVMTACKDDKDGKGSDSNTYKTPITLVETLLNQKSLSKIIDSVPSLLNGFGEEQANTVLSTLKKSEQYETAIEQVEEYFDQAIENLKEECGSNYKIKIEIEEEEKLDKEDCEAFQEQLNQVGEYEEQIEMESGDYDDMAEDLGISVSQAKDVTKAVKEFLKKCGSAKVTEGYKLSVVVKITGSELENAEEQELTVRVFKADGRWVPDVFSLVSEVMGTGLGDIMDYYY